MTYMQGKFGPVTIETTSNSRRLLINDQVQGGCFLQPPASILSSDLGDGPGPVSESPYVYGWLMAGLQYPAGTGVMVGLGSGIGAVCLLTNFPDINLTIVEIDPVVIKLATENFPLINYFRDLGKLEIVEADASKYFSKPRHFNFGLADAYTGSSRLVDTYLVALIKACDSLFFNCVDALNGRSLREVCRLAAGVGKPIECIYKLYYPNTNPKFSSMSNWILATDSISDWEMDGFEPYGNLDLSPWPTLEKYIQAVWLTLLTNVVKTE